MSTVVVLSEEDVEALERGFGRGLLGKKWAMARPIMVMNQRKNMRIIISVLSDIVQIARLFCGQRVGVKVS